MAEGGRLDILSMALQQTGVEQNPMPQDNSSSNDILSSGLNSFIGVDLLSGFSPAPPPLSVKQEQLFPVPMATSNVPVHPAQDPLSLACATYLDPPPPTANIKLESHVSYNGACTEVKSQPMDFSQPDSFNLEDFNFDDFLGTPTDPNDAFSCNQLLQTSLPQLRDDDLSQILDELTNTPTPTFSAPPGSEYFFPPRQPPKYNMGYNGRGVTAAQRLMTPAASVNGPNGSCCSPRPNMLQTQRMTKRPSPNPNVQKFKLEPKSQVNCVFMHVCVTKLCYNLCDADCNKSYLF